MSDMENFKIQSIEKLLNLDLILKNYSTFKIHGDNNLRDLRGILLLILSKLINFCSPWNHQKTCQMISGGAEFS